MRTHAKEPMWNGAAVSTVIVRRRLLAGMAALMVAFALMPFRQSVDQVAQGPLASQSP